LKDMFQVDNPIAAPFEKSDFVVEAFDKATSQAMDEVVCDLIHPVLQRYQEAIIAIHPAAPHALHLQAGFSSRWTSLRNWPAPSGQAFAT
jgi:hypothetical protein